MRHRSEISDTVSYDIETPFKSRYVNNTPCDLPTSSEKDNSIYEKAKSDIYRKREPAGESSTFRQITASLCINIDCFLR